jgi:hypothetical protein
MFTQYSGEGIGHKSTCHALRDTQVSDDTVTGFQYGMDESEWLDEGDTFIVTRGTNEEEDLQSEDSEVTSTGISGSDDDGES